MRHAPALWLTLALAGTMAAAAAAETVVAPGDFEAMAEGRTLHFSLDGAPYGSEQFFPGRRTLWRFAADACQRGAWRADGDRICFAYEGTEGAICWHFIDTGAGHVAALVEGAEDAGFRLTLDRIDTAPLPCPGPEVGS